MVNRRNGLTFLAVVLVVFVAVLISFSTFFSLGETKTLSLPMTAVSHQSMPKPLRAIYMSSWVAGNNVAREKLLKKLEGTNINTIVLDVKDTSGKIVVKLNAPALAKYDSFDSRVPDITEFISELHQKGYYVIGHIAVFQDNHLTKLRPDLAINRSDTGQIWEDKKGMAWLDPSS
ncbi:MAG: hypothetical protein NT041_00305, partial [Candidatus Vogelbacteria bacterium]|nr:hypothetical protein [Candidatus Vogelbacteria bacterium]